jgi:glycosyltransferase involved in cell wall biosynthesis
MALAPLRQRRDDTGLGGLRNMDRPITVLQVLPALDVGGVERGAVEIARAVAGAGGRALVACAGGRLEGRLRAAGATLIEGPFATKSPGGIWRNAARLADVIRAEAVDVVHARSRAPAWSAWIASRRTGAPFVTTWHGVYGERGPFKKLYNGVMARGRPTIAISQFVADLIRDRYGLDDRHIRLIHRGADIEAFAEESVSGERTVALTRAWGLTETPQPLVMMPGRLSRWKGFEDFVNAAAALKARRGPDFLFVIVGPDGGSGFAEKLLAQARDLGCLDVVRAVGPCEDMPAAYKLSAVVVSASTQPEAFGRVAVEAQAMGRPVIASDHGGARETVAHGQTGWLFPPGDARALASAVDEALSLDASGRAHMGMAGRARVASRFTVAAMQRATLDVYEEVTGRSFGVRLE